MPNNSTFFFNNILTIFAFFHLKALKNAHIRGEVIFLYSICCVINISSNVILLFLSQKDNLTYIHTCIRVHTYIAYMYVHETHTAHLRAAKMLTYMQQQKHVAQIA